MQLFNMMKIAMIRLNMKSIANLFVNATKKLLEKVSQKKIKKFIFMSSVVLYSDKNKMPVNENGELIFEIDSKEIFANQELRQVQFERLQTTDDHLMHCVGLAKSKNGKKFYIMKNSWGKVGPYDGYTYMSETYLIMKTVSIMLNKNGLPKEIKEITAKL